MKRIGLILSFLLVLNGCSSVSVVSGSPQSNLVVHPYYEYHGVEVEPSHNWYMGNKEGLGVNDKLRFGDNNSGAFFENATNEKQDTSEVDSSSSYGNGVCSTPSPEVFKEWVVHFDSASSEPLDFSRVRKELEGIEADRLEVSGHTDDVGSDTFNMDLSKRRAEQVGALTKDVLPNVEVQTTWSGECPSVELNVDDRSRALNRRVSIRAFRN